MGLGQGSDSMTSIQTAKITTWTYTNGIEPAYAVMRSAIRDWIWAARSACCVRTLGWCSPPLVGVVFKLTSKVRWAGV